MKLLKIFFVLIWGAGCSTTGIHESENSTNIKNGSQLLLTSECSKKCRSLISNSFEIEPYSDFWGADRVVAPYVILVGINGINGKTTYYNPEGSYNSTWSGKFKKTIPSGETTLRLRGGGSVRSAPNELLEVVFNAEPNKQYYVGSMGWKRFINNTKTAVINHWHPVIVNITNNQVIYPSPNEVPKWRKYCSLWAGGGGDVHCPK